MKEIYKLLHHWIIVIYNLKALKIVLKLNKILPKPHPYLVHLGNSSPLSYKACWTSPKPNKDTIELGNILPEIRRSQRQETWHADEYLASTRSLIFTILIFSFFTWIRDKLRTCLPVFPYNKGPMRDRDMKFITKILHTPVYIQKP